MKQIIVIIAVVVLMSGCGSIDAPYIVNSIQRPNGIYCEYHISQQEKGPNSTIIVDTIGKYQVGDVYDINKH